MLRIFIWAINKSCSFMENKCEKMLKSAQINGVNAELLGLGHDFISHSQRMEILRDALEEMGEQDRNSTVVVVMDGSDTLFNGPGDVIIERFKQMNTRILIAAEKAYTYQYATFKDKFDKIITPYPYRYVNAGAYMGYGSSLLNLMNELLHMKSTLWPHANDQGLLGIWAYYNMASERLMKMDLNCDIFWVTCNDWNNLLRASLSAEKFIRNKRTETVPPIIHLTCLGSPRVAEIYNLAYKAILSSSERNEKR